MRSIHSRTAFSLYVIAAMLAMMVHGCTDGNPADPNANWPHAGIEQSVHEKINAYRISKGLAPLALNGTITVQSRDHSADMADGSVPFSHNGFEERVAAIENKINVQGAAENVAFNLGSSDPAARAVEDWIDSPSHRTNIEGDFTTTGIGVARNAKGEYYFTQIFVKQ